MKAFIITLSTIGILFAAGCQSALSIDDNENEDILEPQRPENLPDPELSAKLGYVRYTADEVNDETEDGKEITIDREQMADLITRMILRSDHFNEAASLVTDKEVVIAYELKPGLDQAQAKDIAAKTAASILPSFYRIHTTDNPTHMNDIHSLHLSTTDRTSEIQTIEKIINEITDEHVPKRR